MFAWNQPISPHPITVTSTIPTSYIHIMGIRWCFALSLKHTPLHSHVDCKNKLHTLTDSENNLQFQQFSCASFQRLIKVHLKSQKFSGLCLAVVVSIIKELHIPKPCFRGPALCWIHKDNHTVGVRSATMLKVIWNYILRNLMKQTNTKAGQLILFIVITAGNTQIHCVWKMQCVYLWTNWYVYVKQLSYWLQKWPQRVFCDV